MGLPRRVLQKQTSELLDDTASCGEGLKAGFTGVEGMESADDPVWTGWLDRETDVQLGSGVEAAFHGGGSGSCDAV